MYSIHNEVAVAEKFIITLKTKVYRYMKLVDVKDNTYPPSMQCHRDVSVSSHISRDVVDHAETPSRRRNRYVNETDLFETFLQRLIGTWKKMTYLRRHNDVPVDT